MRIQSSIVSSFASRTFGHQGWQEAGLGDREKKGWAFFSCSSHSSKPSPAGRDSRRARSKVRIYLVQLISPSPPAASPSDEPQP